MREWGGGARAAARLLCAAASVALVSAPALAQQNLPSDTVDPSEPLDPMPDLGVEWPDLDQAPADEPLAGSPEEAPEVLVDSATERHYTIAIDGLQKVGNSEALVEQFQQQSALYEGRREDANAAQIQRRSETDAELLTEILRSQGYYDATVEPVLEPEGAVLHVTLEVDPGAQYRFQSVELPGLEAAGPDADALRTVFDVNAGDAVIAEDVIAADLALKVALGEQGFALAEIGEQQIVVDHQTGLASLVLPVNPGPVAHFGAIRVSGEPPFGARHVATIARFEPGERFERHLVDDLRRALIATGLVASADVSLVPVAEGRTVDLDVRLTPAPQHTIAGEAGYGTGEGARLEASWQNRNFVNPEGALTLRGIAGTREQLVGVQFRRNNFGARDRVLDLQLSASNSDFEAYEARTVRFLASLERQSNIIWRKRWTWGIGTELLATDERGIFNDPAMEETRTFLIAALPANLFYDGSDDLLNPTRGFRAGVRLSPELSARGGSFAYARAQFDGSAYLPVAGSTVLAGRVRLGSILGADAPSIAPSRRFYSGGGGSVRGYGYQQVGPRDFEGDPIGGKTLTEFGVEARFRLNAFGGNFGVVPFFDGGALTNKVTPEFDNWQFGAGIGIRYYSSFGPIRIDIGTPLNPREGDGPVAVAVSLGQAF